MSAVIVVILVVLVVLYARRTRRLWRRYRVHPNRRCGLPGDRCFSPTVKRIIYVRDGGRCRHCGISDAEVRAFTGHGLQYDHIRPYSWGGLSTVENGQLLCARCNLRKGARYVG